MGLATLTVNGFVYNGRFDPNGLCFISNVAVAPIPINTGGILQMVDPAGNLIGPAQNRVIRGVGFDHRTVYFAVN
ncbi:MAG: hypothetical protein KBS56_04765 [Clostridiales bacterium]|nr:hypothetical protein [Candidatus Crickella equi]